MVQTARPSSDVTTDSWTTAPLFSKVNDVSDATFITSPAATTECEVALASLTDPASSTGHTVFVRAKATGSGAGEKLTWYLYEGTTLRATSSATTIDRSAVQEVSYTLTGAEADALSDYANLRVRLARTTGGAGETIAVYDVWMEVPDASAPVVVTPGTASLTTTLFAPTVTASDHKVVIPGTASLTLSVFAPTVTASQNVTVTPGVAALSLTAFAPDVSVSGGGVSVTPGTASLTLTTFTPSVTVSDNKLVTPGVASLSLTTFTPTVTTSANRLVTPGPASLTLTAYPPTVTGSVPLGGRGGGRGFVVPPPADDTDDLIASGVF